jgi:hypothetical protein
MLSLSPGNFYHAPDSGQDIVFNHKSVTLLLHFSIKSCEYFLLFYHFWTTGDSFLGVLILSLFTSFGRVILLPPSKNMKHWKFLNFENAHPLNLNFHGNVPGYCSKIFPSLEISTTFLDFSKLMSSPKTEELHIFQTCYMKPNLTSNIKTETINQRVQCFVKKTW